MKFSLFTSLALSLTLSSCSLPPREVWNKIQTEGLLAYLREPGIPARTSYAYVATPPEPPAPPVAIKDVPAGTQVAQWEDEAVPTKTQEPERAQPRPTITVVAPRDAKTQSLGAPAAPQRPAVKTSINEKMLVAQSVPALPGFVRSPYTSPPRLVDVKGASAGGTMICPYTQRPFLIPDDFASQPRDSALVINGGPPIKAPVTPAPAPSTRDPVIVEKKELPVTPSPAASIFGTPPAAPNIPPVVAASNTKPNAQPPSKPGAQEIPFGFNIPGRPGFVHSPYAAKNQLVDVTGLPVGMEVKCPYTGKVFRVPGPNLNVQKGGILAAPEKLEKK